MLFLIISHNQRNVDDREKNGTNEQYQREQKEWQRIKGKLDKRLKVASEEEESEGPIFETLHLILLSDESNEEDPATDLNCY